MNKKLWFYLWIAITSYMAGPIMYALTMYTFYQETDVLTTSLIGWTAATFSSVGILFILVTVILLRVLHIYYFWLQTLLFELLFLVLVYRQYRSALAVLSIYARRHSLVGVLGEYCIYEFLGNMVSASAHTKITIHADIQSHYNPVYP
ncbi:hypothetical protein [Paenibacillus sp. LK1]|uniref:hypothetical protein n=1 Tax=Paenibacillus sp. LK1 TaxID=2053014 RepID=UPI000C1A2B20|nr:hypothetical protein [Paenibacillus sp. LK1]PIH59522.1 hypothetical protein CS562_11590 [Paenibacillus sp. LK1]